MSQEKINELAVHKSLILKQAYKHKPLLWLREQVSTRDEHDLEKPVKPFPIKPYTSELIELFQKENVIFLTKSRQMQATWFFCAMAVHMMQFFDYRLVLAISKKQEDAFSLVDGRMKFIYNHQDLWLQSLCPLDRQMRDQPQGHLFLRNGSKALGLAQGPDQVRMHTASLILADEAAFQEQFEETYAACSPSIFGGGKFVAFSSINPGAFARICELER